MTSDLDSPATLEDMVRLFTVITIEILRHATLTSRDADQAMIDMANDFLSMSNQMDNPRAAMMLRSFAKNLIATEPGSDPA